MFKRYWLLLILPLFCFLFYFTQINVVTAAGDNGLPCASGSDFRSRMQGPWAPDRFDGDPVGIRYSPRWDIFYYAQCLDPATSGVLQTVLDKVIADGKITKDGCNGGRNIAFDSQGNLKLCSDEADSYVGIRGSGASAVWLVAYYDNNNPSLPLGANPPTHGGPFSQPRVATPPTQGLPTNLGQLISQIFTWSLGILGIAVFVVFFYSGFLWLTAAGNTAKIGDAKSHMTNAVFGAILLLSSYLILYTINPDFVKNTVNLPGLGTTAPGGVKVPGQPIPTASLLSDLQTERAKYGETITHEEAGKILNAVTWKNSSVGWGLLSKSGGNNCPLNGTGQPISCDWLVYKPSLLGLDVLNDAPSYDDAGAEMTGKATPYWGDGFPVESSKWVAPIAP